MTAEFPQSMTAEDELAAAKAKAEALRADNPSLADYPEEFLQYLQEDPDSAEIFSAFLAIEEGVPPSEETVNLLEGLDVQLDMWEEARSEEAELAADEAPDTDAESTAEAEPVEAATYETLSPKVTTDEDFATALEENKDLFNETTGDFNADNTAHMKILLPDETSDSLVQKSRIHHFVGPEGKVLQISVDKLTDTKLVSGGKEYTWKPDAKLGVNSWVDAGGNRLLIYNGTEFDVVYTTPESVVDTEYEETRDAGEDVPGEDAALDNVDADGYGVLDEDETDGDEDSVEDEAEAVTGANLADLEDAIAAIRWGAGTVELLGADRTYDRVPERYDDILDTAAKKLISEETDVVSVRSIRVLEKSDGAAFTDKMLNDVGTRIEDADRLIVFDTSTGVSNNEIAYAFDAAGNLIDETSEA